ncbi:MAG: RNA-protein complex protein Nop10 [Candidatus Hodarchaeota archaeon]
MPKMLQQCQKCTHYTLQKPTCPHCGNPVKTAHPPKFSPEDKYGKFRRTWKKKMKEEKNPSKT